jgi:hypothetical protein
VTKIYINGKQVTKEEIKNHEIKLESVKRIFVGKLTKKEK